MIKAPYTEEDLLCHLLKKSKEFSSLVEKFELRIDLSKDKKK